MSKKGVNSLKDLLVEIQSDHSLQSVKRGSEFEDLIAKKLEDNNFNSVDSFDDKQNKIIKQYLKDLKEELHSKTSSSLIKNSLTADYGSEFSCFFIAQPYGTQNFPDFLVFTEDYIFPIECKFVNKNTNKPVWNGNLPKAETIYLFGSHRKNEITFFKGETVLEDKERQLLIEYSNRMKLAMKQIQEELKQQFEQNNISSEYGFELYYRETFLQSKQINSNAEMDFFKNKLNNENIVLNWINQL